MDFIAKGTEVAKETEVTEENYEAEVTEKASETNEAAGEGFQKDFIGNPIFSSNFSKNFPVS